MAVPGKTVARGQWNFLSFCHSVEGQAGVTLPLSSSPATPEARLSHWSFCHAILVLLSVSILWAAKIPWALSLFGGVSFLFLVFGARRCWTERGAFGWANGVTSLRLAGVLVLSLLGPTFGPGLVILFGVSILLADGLDGWIARRLDQASEFGEYFDKETDALLLLVLCNLAVLNGRLGFWILIPGVLRYGFVIVLHFFRPYVLKEQKSGRARMIYSLIMAGVLAAFLPYTLFYKTFAVIGTTGLLLSFAVDIYAVFSSGRTVVSRH
jgi:phosphatidylglycerophosphate synthase